ncbi:MAG: glutamine synthetase [Rhodospirillales bacterium]|nr:glutamine synthetase [Rhodospirillales bacterium]
MNSKIDLKEWFEEHRITEVECLVPDITGIPRGKIMPAEKFLKGGAPRLPEAIFIQSVTGEYPDDPTDKLTDPAIIDIKLIPDASTVRLVPWAHEPTAQIIHDCQYANGTPVPIAPRQVLQRVLKLYEDKGWQPVLAPELEFYLVGRNTDPDYPLTPPVGRSGRQETGRQAYSIDAVNEFDPLFEEMYDFCDMQEMDLDTLIHEEGAAQVEINLLHGDPLHRADQVFLFKRTVREVALRHNIYATFMAKPMGGEPGRAMHVHQSIVDPKTGENLFAGADGKASPLFKSYLAGLQKYIPAVMPIFAPNVNSYRRLTRFSNAPINLQWGYDNRTCGLRVPFGDAAAMRVENRVPGADANPYLAFAATLACGYLGMVEKLEAPPEQIGSAYSGEYTLPRELSHALDLMDASKPIREILDDKLVDVLVAVKRLEYETYLRVISSWEREHLLLNV